LYEGDREPPGAMCTAHAKPASSKREFCVKSPTHEPAMAGTIAAERPLALSRFARGPPPTTQGTLRPGEPPNQRSVLMVVVPDNGTDLFGCVPIAQLLLDRPFPTVPLPLDFQQMARPSANSPNRLPEPAILTTGQTDSWIRAGRGQ
jgi:hypothetical protein